MKKQRNIQIEIIRILAMFMIVLGHVFLYGHVAENVQNSMMTREIITAIKVFACIFREICASVPEERSAIPLETEQRSVG